MGRKKLDLGLGSDAVGTEKEKIIDAPVETEISTESFVDSPMNQLEVDSEGNEWVVLPSGRFRL